MSSFADLVSDVTEESIRLAIKSAGLAVNLDFDALPPNSVVRALANSVIPRALVSFVQVMQQAIRGGFLDWAPDGENSWLDNLGEQVYGVPRIRATFATGPATFTNTSGNLYSFAPLQVVVAHATSDKTYRNVSAFTLSPLGTATGVDLIAEELGTDSNADTGEITTMVTTFDGVTVTNTSPALANDLETAAAYRERCRESLAVASLAGAEDAYDFRAKSALRVDGSAIGVTRTSTVDNDVSGEVTVYLADADGVVAGADVARINDLLTGTATDEFSTPGVVPNGVNFLGAFSADPVIVNVTYSGTALASAGLTISEIEELVETDLGTLFASAPIGGWTGFFFQSKIQSTIEQVQAEPGAPEPFVDVAVTLPAANVALLVSEVAVLGTITPTITLV